MISEKKIEKKINILRLLLEKNALERFYMQIEWETCMTCCCLPRFYRFGIREDCQKIAMKFRKKKRCGKNGKTVINF